MRFNNGDVIKNGISHKEINGKIDYKHQNGFIKVRMRNFV